MWLLHDGTLKNTFKLHPEKVRALVAMPDNQHALSGARHSERVVCRAPP